MKNPVQSERLAVPDFCGQNAVVTGASSGIGKAIACGLAARGAAVAVIGRRLEQLEELARAGSARGGRMTVHRVDLSVPAEIEAFAAGCGRVEMLVHSAGVIALGTMEKAPAADFDRQWNVNLRAPYVLTRALLARLKSSRGQIVFINSTAGLTANAGAGTYAATKHALKALADSLRDEMNDAGVRVLTAFVGRTATPMQAAVHAFEGRRYAPDRLIQPEDVAEVVLNALSLPRTVEVTAIHMRPCTKPD